MKEEYMTKFIHSHIKIFFSGNKYISIVSGVLSVMSRFQISNIWGSVLRMEGKLKSSNFVEEHTDSTLNYYHLTFFSLFPLPRIGRHHDKYISKLILISD